MPKCSNLVTILKQSLENGNSKMDTWIRQPSFELSIRSWRWREALGEDIKLTVVEANDDDDEG